jgi:hypothetical protein
MFLLLIAAIAFVVLGAWLLFDAPEVDNSIFSNLIVRLSAGIASILFFGLAAITIAKKITDKSAGFVINAEGIIDNSSGVSAGVVKWADIQEIQQLNIVNQKLLMIIVKNPQIYIDREKNGIKRKAMQMNLNSFGSPISISANALDMNFDTLHELLQRKFNENKS